MGIKAHGQRNLLCLKEVPEDKGAPDLDSSAHVHDEHFSKLYIMLPELKEYLNWYRGEKNNRVHACNKMESHMCGTDQVIEELFYTKEVENR